MLVIKKTEEDQTVERWKLNATVVPFWRIHLCCKVTFWGSDAWTNNLHCISLTDIAKLFFFFTTFCRYWAGKPKRTEKNFFWLLLWEIVSSEHLSLQHWIYHCIEMLQKCRVSDSMIESCMMCSPIWAKRENIFFSQKTLPPSSQIKRVIYICMYMGVIIKELYVFSCQETRPCSYADNLQYVKFRAVCLYIFVTQSF